MICQHCNKESEKLFDAFSGSEFMEICEDCVYEFGINMIWKIKEDKSKQVQPVANQKITNGN